VKSVRFDSYGGTDVLQLVDVELDAPAAEEVAVAVRAAGINPGDPRDGWLWGL
jgi:NADPH:quinone reductase-like Zn-dependent oxidoreductase